jgi:hypothetical protein
MQLAGPTRGIMVIVLMMFLGVIAQSEADLGQLTIVAPRDGSTVSPGSKIQVEVRLAEGLRPLTGVMVSFPGGIEVDKTPPFEFSIEVARDQPPGDFPLTALARLPDSMLTSKVRLTVSAGGELVSIRVDPSSVSIDDTDPPVFYLSQQPLRVEGVFDDGVTRDLTLTKGTRLESRDVSIAAIAYMEPPSPRHPMVRGLREGRTVVVVRHGEHEVEVPVEVSAAGP